jgi:AbrB family looped-hinge helix DNA binding protein
MRTEYTTVKAKGQIVIPVELRRKLKLKEGTKLALSEAEGKLVIQPITDEFIDSVHGMLAGKGLPDRVDRDPDRELW